MMSPSFGLARATRERSGIRTARALAFLAGALLVAFAAWGLAALLRDASSLTTGVVGVIALLVMGFGLVVAAHRVNEPPPSP